VEYPGNLEFTVRFIVDNHPIEKVEMVLSGSQTIEVIWLKALKGDHTLRIKFVSFTGRTTFTGTMDFTVVSQGSDWTVVEDTPAEDAGEEMETVDNALYFISALFILVPIAVVVVSSARKGKRQERQENGKRTTDRASTTTQSVHGKTETDVSSALEFSPKMNTIASRQPESFDESSITALVGLSDRMEAPRAITPSNEYYDVSVLDDPSPGVNQTLETNPRADRAHEAKESRNERNTRNEGEEDFYSVSLIE